MKDQDGISLTSISHPGTELNPESLESIEIELPERRIPRFCWHRWGKWLTFQKGLFSWQQYRGCDKCGKVKLREAHV